MRASNVLGIIYASVDDDRISELTAVRTIGSVPFAGRYRLIDFALSNMVNAGITAVGVSTKSNYRSLIIPDGGYRNPISPKSFEYYECKDGIKRNRTQSNMEGEDILSFAMHAGPKCIKELLEHFELSKDEVNYFLIHQANRMINKLVQKRLKVEDERCPYNIEEFGNSSSTTIPLMIVNKLQNVVAGKKIVACGFGTGLAWGAMFNQLGDITVCDLIHYEQ